MPAKWKEILKPYADAMADLHHNLEAMDENQIKALREACEKPTSTNCWWAEKRAADFLKQIIAAEYGRRTMEEMNDAIDAMQKQPT